MTKLLKSELPLTTMLTQYALHNFQEIASRKKSISIMYIPIPCNTLYMIYLTFVIFDICCTPY